MGNSSIPSGQYLGVLGQEAHWHVGDSLSYQRWYPRDVILDMKRIRSHEFYKEPKKEKMDIEIEADHRASTIVSSRI